MPPFLVDAFKRRLLIAAAVLIILTADYATGPSIRFPIFFVPPILLAAWYEGFGPASFVSAILMGARFLMRFGWTSVPWPLVDSVVNLITNLAGALLLAWFVARAGRLTREINILKGVVQACRYCSKVRLEEENWVDWHRFLHENSEAILTERICPTCAARGLARR